jgi:Domain of unknown function (DUF4124)
MRRFEQILGGFLLAIALPTAAGGFPMRFGGPRGHVFSGGHAFTRAFPRAPFMRRPFFRSRVFSTFVVPFPIGISAAWPPYYGYSPAYAGPAYDVAPAYAPPEVQAIPSAPPLPPMPDVVEFSTGRYERRGDGIGTAYTWVWIPNPPTVPPPQSDPGDASAAPARPPPGRLYRWTDEQGVVHLTNLWREVPPQYRQQAKHPHTS